jgi:hypothetical protein
MVPGIESVGPSILRMYFASGRSTEQIAAVLQVNRSTAGRRLVAARKDRVRRDPFACCARRSRSRPASSPASPARSTSTSR